MTDTPRDDSATRARRQTCLKLARELLLVGPDGEDLKLGYLHTLIDTGHLGATHHPRKKILVVGAGITGLVAGRLQGPVHFAGEHTSLKHAWIEGAPGPDREGECS
ncbi:hypothetical protein ACFQ7G_23265 [Streptomyces massasporeus]